jgi:hypothetical protein
MAGMIIRDQHESPLLEFGFGLGVLFLALYGTATGKAVGKGGRVDRAKNPFEYWFVIALQYGLAVFLFCLFISSD